MRPVLLVLLLTTLAACDFIGGADTLVRGSNNVIAADTAPELVAQELARFDAVPAVTDADLVAIYDNLRSRALAGEVDAARVVLRLAAIQRALLEEDETDDE